MITGDGETEDDIFVLFGSILNRINEERERKGLIGIHITDAERGRAIRDYVDTYPRDRIVWGD